MQNIYYRSRGVIRELTLLFRCLYIGDWSQSSSTHAGHKITVSNRASMAPAIWHTQQQNNVYHRHSRCTVGTLDKLIIISKHPTKESQIKNKVLY